MDKTISIVNNPSASKIFDNVYEEFRGHKPFTETKNLEKYIKDLYNCRLTTCYVGNQVDSFLSYDKFMFETIEDKIAFILRFG